MNTIAEDYVSQEDNNSMMDVVQVQAQVNGMQNGAARVGRKGPMNRYNSTSTVHVDDSMAHPDNDAIILSLASTVLDMVSKGEKKRANPKLRSLSTNNLPVRQAKKARSSSTEDPADTHTGQGNNNSNNNNNDNNNNNNNNATNGNQQIPGPENPEDTRIPDENEDPRTIANNNLQKNLPSIIDVFRFIKNIFVTAQCSVDCCVICHIYLERFLETSGLLLNLRNWRSITMTSMLLASKVWDDLSMVNADFSVFMPYSLEQINTWERQFLAGMKYNVRVSAAKYATHFFDLRQQGKALKKELSRPDSVTGKLAKNPFSTSENYDTGHREGEYDRMDDDDGNENSSGDGNGAKNDCISDRTVPMEQARKLEVLSSTMEARLLELRGHRRAKSGNDLRRAISDQHKASLNSSGFIID